MLGNHDYIWYAHYINQYSGVGEAFEACTPNTVVNATMQDCLNAACCYSPAFQTTAAINDSRWRLETGVWDFSGTMLQLIMLDSNPITYADYATHQPLYDYVPGGLADQSGAANLAAVGVADVVERYEGGHYGRC